MKNVLVRAWTLIRDLRDLPIDRKEAIVRAGKIRTIPLPKESQTTVVITHQVASTPKVAIGYPQTTITSNGYYSSEPSQETIALLAYTLWQERGCPEDSSNEDWIRAERQLSPSYQAIEELAYKFWQERGCPHGSPEQDWLRAEQQIRQLPSFSK